MHNARMTMLLDEAVRQVRTLPDDAQDDYARMLMRLTGRDTSVYRLTEQEDADLALAEAEAARGEFASQAEVDAVLPPQNR